MNTDRLIHMLSTNLEPVRPGRVSKTITWALVIGGVAAFFMMLTTLGLRDGLVDGAHLDVVSLKLLFTLSLVGAAALFLTRSVRSGRAQTPFTLIHALLLTFGAAAIAVLAVERPAAWRGLILGTEWATALVCIPLFAAAAFASLIWALRMGAPTNLKRIGAIAGLAAGAIGAAAYAFQCPDDSLPFIVVCYGAAIAFTALIGALLGPRLLRW